MFMSFIRALVPEEDAHDEAAHASLWFANRLLLGIFLGYFGFLVASMLLYFIAGCSYQGSLGALTTCSVKSLMPLVELTNWSPLLHMAIIFVGMPLWALAALGTGTAGVIDVRRACRREGVPLAACVPKVSAFWNLVLATLSLAGIIVVLALAAA